MRSQLEMQKDPLWDVIHGKLTQQERDLLVEVMTDIRREAFEECAKIVKDLPISELISTSATRVDHKLTFATGGMAQRDAIVKVLSEHPNP